MVIDDERIAMIIGTEQSGVGPKLLADLPQTAVARDSPELVLVEH